MWWPQLGHQTSVGEAYTVPQGPLGLQSLIHIYRVFLGVHAWWPYFRLLGKKVIFWILTMPNVFVGTLARAWSVLCVVWILSSLPISKSVHIGDTAADTIAVKYPKVPAWIDRGHFILVLVSYPVLHSRSSE